MDRILPRLWIELKILLSCECRSGLSIESSNMKKSILSCMRVFSAFLHSSEANAYFESSLSWLSMEFSWLTAKDASASMVFTALLLLL